MTWSRLRDVRPIACGMRRWDARKYFPIRTRLYPIAHLNARTRLHRKSDGTPALFRTAPRSFFPPWAGWVVAGSCWALHFAQ